MSLVRMPREIKITPAEITIKISGNYYSSSYGYVQVGTTKYTSNQTLTLNPPVSITVYVSAQGSSYRSNCQVTLDGVVVQSGYGGYSFTANKSYTITLTRTGSTSSTRYWRAAIVSG